MVVALRVQLEALARVLLLNCKKRNTVNIVVVGFLAIA